MHFYSRALELKLRELKNEIFIFEQFFFNFFTLLQIFANFFLADSEFGTFPKIVFLNIRFLRFSLSFFDTKPETAEFYQSLPAC